MPGPLVTRAEFNALATAERLELMLGRTLEDIWAVLEYPIEECLADANRHAIILTTKVQTHRAILHTCMKLGLEGRRSGVRERTLDLLSESLRARLKEMK